MLASLDQVIAAVVVALVVSEVAGRSSSGRKSAVAAGLVAAGAALAAGWFDVSPLGGAILLYWLGSWTQDRARRSARDRRRRELGEQTAERAVDGAPADETLLTAGVRVRPRTGAAAPLRS